MTPPQALPVFPGAVGLTTLTAYASPAPDGATGGSPHVHIVCSEAYVVVAGSGRLETLARSGHRTVPLTVGDVVWFGPGTVHRAINDGGLRVVTVMQNSGLPEAGDAVMTFPDEDLRSRAAYLAAADIAGASSAERFQRAALRRDRAVDGFTALTRAYDAGDHHAFERFLRKAVAIVEPVSGHWATRVEEGPLANASEALDHIAAIRSGTGTAHLDGFVARVPRPDETTAGMCGALLAYDPIREGTQP